MAKLCRRLNVGQVALAGEIVDSGVSDMLPHVVERRSVGGRSAVALADDQVDLIGLSITSGGSVALSAPSSAYSGPLKQRKIAQPC